jgi:excisionase family DNA binding protein
MTDSQSYDIADTLTVAEAAALLGCSGQTVRERIKRGELGGVLVRTATGKAWRVVRSGPLAVDRQTSSFDTSDEVGNQEVDQIRKLPATSPQPGVVEALALLQAEMARSAALAEENARLREQLAARPLALAAPEQAAWWLALWAQLAARLGAGRPG